MTSSTLTKLSMIPTFVLVMPVIYQNLPIHMSMVILTFVIAILLFIPVRIAMGINASMAKKRRRSELIWALMGVFFPLSTLILFMLPETPVGLIPCPHCAEPIRPEAKVCRYCGRDKVLSAA